MSTALYDHCAEILAEDGFVPIGQLDYRLHLSVWWNPAPDRRLQVTVLRVGNALLLKGDKSYCLRSIGPEGETAVRDIRQLHDYLESHFPELRLAFSFFRDIPKELAHAEIERRSAATSTESAIPDVEAIARLQHELAGLERHERTKTSLVTLSSMPSALLDGYLHQQARRQQNDAQKLKERLNQLENRQQLSTHLQHEYLRKGSAASHSFSIHSNLQVAHTADEFRDRLRAVVKELMDLHRYQVTQKLRGGRLQIQFDEESEPAVAWLEQWFGGALSPTQLFKAIPELAELQQAARDRYLVTPDEPILVDGHVRNAEQHLGARCTASLLSRLDSADSVEDRNQLERANLAPHALPLHIGRVDNDSQGTQPPVRLPLSELGHVAISGTTGSGKSVLARVLVEEVAKHEEVGIVVVDPRNQWSGLLVPEDREPILARYAASSLARSSARGYPFHYFAPGAAWSPDMPSPLDAMISDKSVVSLKSLDDAERCVTAATLLQGLFDICSRQETDRPRLVIVIDEAHLFTRKRTDDTASPAALAAERAIDRIAREGRKFGIHLVLVTQSIMDFGRDLVSIRQMISTRFFLRNSDRELEYAADMVGDGRQLLHLPTGCSLVHNATWGVMRVTVRPPYSKMSELPDDRIRQLTRLPDQPGFTASAEATELLAAVRSHYAQSSEFLNLTVLSRVSSITSKRRLLELVDELSRLGLVTTRSLPERGRPRVVELSDKAMTF